MMDFLLKIFELFYYVVIFLFVKSENDIGYGEIVEWMVLFVVDQLGFLGVESICEVDGRGIMVFYWDSIVVINYWKYYIEY